MPNLPNNNSITEIKDFLLGLYKKIKEFDNNPNTPSINELLAEFKKIGVSIGEFADKFGFDLDMEAKNRREIANTLVEFLEKTYSTPSDQAVQIAEYYTTTSTGNEAVPDAIANAEPLKYIVNIKVIYNRVDASAWVRSIEIYHLSGDKPARYKSESPIPRDELPPEVRKQSITTNQTNFTIQLFPQD